MIFNQQEILNPEILGPKIRIPDSFPFLTLEI